MNTARKSARIDGISAMAMTSRTLTSVREQADGTFIAQEDMVDHLGRHWYSTVRGASEAALTTAMNARDMLPQLRDAEKELAKEFVRAGNDPTTFTRVDLTIPGFETYLLRQFARGHISEDQDYMINVAEWVTEVGPGGAAGNIARIELRLGVNTARATTIRNRALRITALPDGIAAQLALDEADIDGEA